MEAFLVYFGLSFVLVWMVAFSLSMGTLLWFQFVHLVQHVNSALDEIGHHVGEYMHRLLFYLHLSR